MKCNCRKYAGWSPDAPHAIECPNHPWRKESALSKEIMNATSTVRVLEEVNAKILKALTALYQETAEYIEINHLGDIHHNRSMQMARDVLLKENPHAVVLGRVGEKEAREAKCDYTGRPCLDASQVCRCEKCQNAAAELQNWRGKRWPSSL